MGETELRHVAVIGAPEPGEPGTLESAVRSSCTKAGDIAREAFAQIPGLLAFSWIDAGLDALLQRSPTAAAARACAPGAEMLAAVAGELGVALRVCGAAADLPALPAPSTGDRDTGRTLLWFQRYSARDEIVRAAGRFLAAHPGQKLTDGGLDDWLDTAGVPDPDLLIHVGGTLEPRDALLWQGSYAEICHEPGPLSAFTTAGLHRAVADFRDRQRRFGR